MSSPNRAPYFQPSTQAIDAFAEYLSASRRMPVDFAAFCARHSAVAEELRQLSDEWRFLDPSAGTSERAPCTTKGQFKQKLEQLYGPQDPAAWLDSCDGAKPESGGDISRWIQSSPADGSKYAFRGKIEAGGMGVVWRVFDRALRRHLAMKMLKDPCAPAPRERSIIRSIQVRRFLEEAQVTGQLDHPGIVPIHSLGTDEAGRLFFTMKLVKGRDLRSVFQYIKNGDEGWTLTRALSIMLKMCEAVSFAHAKGVIHRDLKPGNIMVGRFGEVYVMDWGVARVLSKPDLHDRRIELTENREFSTILSARRDAREQDPESPLVTMDGSVVGTPAYMSPEQAMGLLDAVDRRSDIYSIGAILYHLLAGHMPYVPDGSRISQKTLLGLVVLGPPPPLARENPSAPAELVAICEKAMARAPGDRYKSVTEIAADIEAFLDRRPVEAAQPSWMRRCLLWTQRNRRVAIVACACAGVLLASWAAWTIQLQNEVGAKTLAIRETATWRDGLATDRLLRELEEQLLPLAPGGTRATELWLREAARLCALAPERRAELDAIAPGSTLYAESKHVVDALSNLDVHRARVERLYSLARTAKRRSIDDRRALWDRACSELAASMGRGAAIDPQEGLVPIRCDPESGLWEFLLLDSGDMPQIDPATQHYKIEESTGIVLVLLPGGTFTRGTPPGAPWRDVNEEPMDVTLAPFFLSKYETTQAQYMRYTEKNPSGKKPPSDRYGISYNFTHPVETVTWPDAQRFCAAFDCELPTESQWEYAARAGSTGKFPWGDADGDIRSFENVSDKSYGKLVHAESPDSTIPWDDGYPFHAPVGRFRPNRFGLHDMLGNVAEWVRDVYARNPRQPVRSDGLVENAAPDETSMVFRGGNFLLTPDYCYSAFRRFAPPQHCNYSLGFRIARAVTKRSP